MAFFAGCAFTPQAVVIAPQINAPTSSIGHSQAVFLNVVDERPKQTLGTKGVRGVGADLTIEGDLTQVVRSAIADGLQKQDFAATTASKASQNNQLRVEIRNLDYTMIMGFWSGTLRVDAGLKANCIQGTTRPYEKLFRGEHVESVQVVQSAEANNKYVSNAVGSAVDELLRDRELMQCLAGNTSMVGRSDSVAPPAPVSEPKQAQAMPLASKGPMNGSTSVAPSVPVETKPPVESPASTAAVMPAQRPTAAPLSASGQDGYSAVRIASERGCHSSPLPVLVAKGPGFESYSVSCKNGDALAIRCEFGSCRALQ